MTLRTPTEIHGPALWLDASGPQLTIALWSDEGALAVQPLPSLRTKKLAAARGVFECVSELLAASGLRLGDLRSCIYVAGPGSALGLRVVVMALRTWATLPACADLRFYAAFTTDILAAALSKRAAAGPFHIAVPQGRLAWSLHARRADGSPLTPEPQRISMAEAHATQGCVLFPADHKLWDPPPPNFEPVCADALAVLLGLTEGRIPLRETELPSVFPTEAPAFRKLGAPPLTLPS